MTCTLHSGGRIEIEVIVERLQAAPMMAANGGAATAAAAATAVTHTPARLLVGSCHDDRLLSIKSMVVETFPSPFTVSTNIS